MGALHRLMAGALMLLCVGSVANAQSRYAASGFTLDVFSDDCATNASSPPEVATAFGQHSVSVPAPESVVSASFELMALPTLLAPKQLGNERISGWTIVSEQHSRLAGRPVIVIALAGEVQTDSGLATFCSSGGMELQDGQLLQVLSNRIGREPDFETVAEFQESENAVRIFSWDMSAADGDLHLIALTRPADESRADGMQQLIAVSLHQDGAE